MGHTNKGRMLPFPDSATLGIIVRGASKSDRWDDMTPEFREWVERRQADADSRP